MFKSLGLYMLLLNVHIRVNATFKTSFRPITSEDINLINHRIITSKAIQNTNIHFNLNVNFLSLLSHNYQVDHLLSH